MVLVRAHLVVALASALGALGCAGDGNERPPGASCPDNLCDFGAPPDNVGGTMAPWPALDAGFAGDDAGSGDTVTLSGVVRVLGTEVFSSGSEFLGTGVVGAEGSVRRVTAEFAGPEYTLEGVISDTHVWADVDPTPGAVDVLPTIQRIGTQGGEVDLVLARAITFENIGIGLLAPVDVSPEQAHAVIRVVDESGRGLPGIVLETGATGGIVTYDTGNGVFRDDQEETTEAGYIVVLAADTVAWPGASRSVTLTGARSGAFTLKMAIGAVTMVTVVL
jgi:hypothetical protein